MASESSDYLHDPTLSLREKLRRRMQEKKVFKFEGNTNPEFFNRWGPWIVLFLLCGAGGWGTAVAMPVLYAGGWEGWLLLGRGFVVVMVMEAALNWSLTRWVSSEYKPDVHGTKPSDFPSEAEISGILNAPDAAKNAEYKNGGGAGGLKSGEGGEGDAAFRKRHVSPDGGSSSDSAPQSGGKGGSKGSAKGRSHDGYSYTMWVAVALPTADGHVERKPYPYWSWVNCLMCRRPRPPRCHHCTLCRMCVLKRDHHCYLTGSCIGVNNHRFFLVFLFWAALLCVFGTAHMLPYTFLHVVPDYDVHFYDFVPPVSLLRGLLGHVSLVIPFLAALFWLLLFFGGAAVLMLGNFLYMLAVARTGFERDHGIKLTDTRSLAGKLRSVFGRYWLVNFLVPTYPWIRPEEDAVFWPYTKPY